MRAVVITAALGGFLYLVALGFVRAFDPSYRAADHPIAESVAPSASASTPGAATAKSDDCTDSCEQRSILEHWPEGALQRCRQGCGHTSGATRPNETPSHISVGAADHSTTAPRTITIAPADHHVLQPAFKRSATVK